MVPMDDKNLQRIFSSLEEGVMITDTERRILFLNPVIERTIGYSAEKVIGRKCFEVFHSHFCHSRCKLFEALETGHEIAAPKITFKNGKGELVCFRGVIIPLGERGNFKGVAQIILNITKIISLTQPLQRQYSPSSFVTKTPALSDLLDILSDLARSDVPILILGETGTGKEILARQIHRESLRSDAPFVRINCGALPDSLVEAELFGTVAGAYTDAKRARKGRLEVAEGGTILLDEIGDMTPSMQVKVLRVIQEKTYEPLGSSTTRRADVRFISATNQDLAKMVEEGRFRKDLFYRINTALVPVPPLRDRREDIPPLVDHFLKKYTVLTGKDVRTVDANVMDILMQASWPGNVRQLEHVIEYAFVLVKGREISVDHLPQELTSDRAGQGSPLGEESPFSENIKSTQKEMILTTLKRHRWNKVSASRDLGISRSTLWRKMKFLSIPLSGATG